MTTTHESEPQGAIDLQTVADAVIEQIGKDGWSAQFHESAHNFQLVKAPYVSIVADWAGCDPGLEPSFDIDTRGFVEVSGDLVLAGSNRRALEAIWACFDTARLAAHDPSEPSEGERE